VMKASSAVALAACAVCCCDAALQVFTADLQALGSASVSGQVTIFVSSTGLQGVGSATGLETNVGANAADCSATNGCGVHVHSGGSCENSTSQGGHFFTGTSDPWSSIGYSFSTASGNAVFKFDVTTSATGISGKPFIIHNKAGSRVACGILSEVTTGVTEASLMNLTSTDVSGSVTLVVNGSMITGAGSASGLEASLSDTTGDCHATNGCGVHVHSGSSCENLTTQGGHYYRIGTSDPWALIRYSSSSSTGAANFVFAVTNPGLTAVQGKAFIVHNNAGGRVSCGLLNDAAAPPPSPSPSPSSNAGVDAASPHAVAGASFFGLVLLGLM